MEPDNGGVSISGYLVQWRTAGQAFSAGREASVSVAMATVGSLVNGTTYFFQVRAINSEGSGAWSNEASATPVLPVPDQAIPDRVAAAPSGVAGNGQIVWSWPCPSDNGSDITGYQFRVRKVGAASWTDRTTTLATRTETGLDNGDEYEAEVRAVNGVGTQTAYSPTGRATPLAEVPDQVQTVALSNAAAGLFARWGVPEANGDPITGYAVQIANNASFTAAASSSVSGTSLTFTGVADGAVRHVRVRAVNGRGAGAYSPGVSLTRDDGRALPDAPDMPVARARRPLLVDWSFSPNGDGGVNVTGYQLQWRFVGAGWSGNIIDAVTEALATHSGGG